MNSFKALVVDKIDDRVKTDIRFLALDELPPGELLVNVVYSSINYKDALACIPNGNIVKTYPFIPGIDMAGIVVESRNEHFKEGDEILVTGYDFGVSHYGGLSQYARIPAEWAVKLPQGLSLKEAMIFGTAGFTAAMSVQELQQNGILPDSGPVLVTGASGGVGSVAVAILSKLGYEVAASTGKEDRREELLKLGASRVMSREEVIPEQARPLNKQIWSGAVDCVGGKTLASILSSVQYGGAVAASGLTGGIELPTTVFPFILRGIRLIGIDSVSAGMARREQVWKLLAGEYKPVMLEDMYTEIALEQVPEVVPSMLDGQSRGRVIVNLKG
ncbi:oxidoreductase [Paenibacillus abyssi]|uniref:oxidoreductase n=1 Tax=Paenibacillus abyssi TaxID=1340531 RepID=UPI00166384D4|nr:oxidoreductase [Paenibacillus abyssi]